MAKVVKGTIVFGGYVAGAVAINVTFDNGQEWEFAGSLAPAFGLSITLPLQAGDFPGFDSLAGGCMIEMAAASAGLIPAGGLVINFNGLLTELGWVASAAAGVEIVAAIGGGKWWQRS